MNRTHFEREMNRLVDTYGSKSYPETRVNLIWREVKDFPDHWMTRTVDSFIKYQRQAPMMSEFNEEMSKERERNHDSLKAVHKQEINELMHSNEIVRTFCQGIRDIAIGKLDGSDKECFKKLVQNTRGTKRWEDKDET